MVKIFYFATDFPERIEKNNKKSESIQGTHTGAKLKSVNEKTDFYFLMTIKLLAS